MPPKAVTTITELRERRARLREQTNFNRTEEEGP